MKKIIFALTFITFSSFAQDSYHAEAIQTCTSESCLVVDGQEIGMVKQIDQEGYESEDLNTKSSLMDLDLDKACFTGDAKDIKRILFALSGNTNSQYFDGGHTQVLDVSVDVSNTHQIQGVITSIDDYTAGNTQTKFSIKNCQ